MEAKHTPSDEELRAAFALEHGGPNPYYRCNTCGAKEPGLREYLAEHWNTHQPALNKAIEQKGE